MRATRITMAAAGALLTLGAALAVQAAEGDGDRGTRNQGGSQAPAARQPSQQRGQAGGRAPEMNQHDWRDQQGRRFDDRHDHGRFYPPRGAYYPSLPDGYRHYNHGGHDYFFHGGVWYEPHGTRFVVVYPPVGMVLSVLPSFYTTLWFGGAPYYYADDVYYRWRPDMNGYAVVDPPQEVDRAPAPGASDDLFIYPKNGQSADQQAADRYECHAWARDQTGFDPTESRGGVPAEQTGARRADYLRAMTACLEARSYSVR